MRLAPDHTRDETHPPRRKMHATRYGCVWFDGRLYRVTDRDRGRK